MLSFRLLTYTAISVCLLSPAFSQTTPKHTYTVGANVNRGVVLIASEAVAQFAGTYPVGLELFIHKNTYGYSYWEQRYRRPDIGFSLLYTDYLNPVLGKSIGGTVYLNLPIARFPASKLTVGFGTGLGVHTNPYRPSAEEGNVLLGTPITLTMRTQFNYTRSLSDRWQATLSAKLVHYSNAAYSRPNRGVNMPMMNLGVSRRLGAEKPAYASPSEVGEPEPYQRLSYYLGASTGLKTLEEGQSPQGFVTLHAYATWRFSPISGLTGGLEAFVDEATRAYIRQRIARDRPDHRRVGFAIGHELFYHRISMLVQMGIYLYRPYQDLYLPFYERIGLRYAFTPHLLGNFTLKVHGGRAEMVELGLGVRF